MDTRRDDGNAATPSELSPGQGDGTSDGFVVASHDVLFAAPGALACDACGGPLSDEDADGFRVNGEGVYMWTRGDERRFERAPLCPDCGAAIGMTALARWEIEEEEG